MSDLLEMISTHDLERQNIQSIFSGEGQSTVAAREAAGRRYQERLLEATRFIGEVFTGRRRLWQLQEAMSTSDFPILFGDVLDRQLLANYASWDIQWNRFVKRGLVRDFRLNQRVSVDGGQRVLSRVEELTEYPAANLSEAEYGYRVYKYGRRLPFSWESFINDDLDALSGSPERLATAARKTEEYQATALFVGEAGPDSTFFSTAHKNKLTGNPVLSVAGLQAGLQAISTNPQVDADGNPILITATVLMVPPALATVAQNILNATEIRTGTGGPTGELMVTGNWLRGQVELVINPWLTVIDTSANAAKTWYLLPSPNSERPAAELGFLRGHETPEIFVKDPNARRVGGGLIAPEDGDFDTDSIEYKVRHVLGGATLDYRATMVSTGAGS